MIDNRPLAVHAFAWCMLALLSVGDMLLQLQVEMDPTSLKHMNSVLYSIT